MTRHFLNAKKIQIFELLFEKKKKPQKFSIAHFLLCVKTKIKMKIYLKFFLNNKKN